MAHLEKIGQFFQVRRSQSISIVSILNHPCSCLVYYYLFGVFLPLVNYYFEDFVNLKVIKIALGLKYRDIAPSRARIGLTSCSYFLLTG